MVVGLLAGCLPAGSPPSGQHIIHDRTLTGVFFTASETDGVPSHLLATGPLRLPRQEVWGPGETDLLADVYDVSPVGGQVAATDLAGQSPLFQDFVLQGGDVGKYIFATDRRGRPVYLRDVQQAGDSYDITLVERFDWSAEQPQYLGHPRGTGESPFLLSPDRMRVFTDSLFELDGWTSLGNVDESQGAFIGDDFYYVTMSTPSNAGPAGLGRSRPGTEPQLLLASTGRIGFAAIQGDGTPQILVCLASDSSLWWGNSCGSGTAPFALLDTQTLATSVLPFHPLDLGFDSASGDGHWLLFTSPNPDNHDPQVSDVTLFLFDRTTGATASVDSSFYSGLPINGAVEWRPGRDELWFYFYHVGRNFGTWTPASGFALASGNPASVTELPDGRKSMFTRDGAYWFSLDEQRTVRVGPADDPTAPTFPIHPAGTLLAALLETGDGRLLVGASTTDLDRQDLAIVDPTTGAVLPIASGGHLVALGHGRVLAMLNWESSSLVGDLVLIDLASGAQTVLAENVLAAAVDPGQTADVPPGADRLASGTRVAFLARSRLESPYDGLWVTTLP